MDIKFTKFNMENIQEKIEDKVIDAMNFSAGGRLIIFKPEKSIFGIDLCVERRGKYKEDLYNFQINSFVGTGAEEKFTKDFPEESFRSDKNFYLLFVYFDEIKQKINDYIWLIPSLQFEDMADIKMEEGKKMLRFEASLSIKEKDKFSRFLVSTKDIGKSIFESFETGGKFDFKKTVFQESEAVSVERLEEFIAEARRNTYAANAMPADNPRLLGSIQLEFQKGDYFYRDIFFNGNKEFTGQEIVYEKSKPVWAMNYVGSKLGKVQDNFLKEALSRLAGKCRFGKICEYEKREFKYEDKGQGKLESFSGEENIYTGGKSVYKLNYQGGLISDKL